MNKTAIIFDLDGTLWGTSKKVLPAWNIVLDRYPELNKKLTQEEMNSFFGKTLDEIAEMMLPSVDEKKRLDFFIKLEVT
ncbi:phosphoglycolate phosphatase [Eubacterium uniforme]|uniref:Phosphoglycolate phosphatase n=1 Tax=Eubacterium uniforme TaxID=39495 RepID=A0A1T4V7V2_9FIRM|nr:HAD hydrolase-like protein [Eubacterium uniforme]SKA60993.1 phosphoglycolate phosphatase [Eubacterium uniforme]